MRSPSWRAAALSASALRLPSWIVRAIASMPSQPLAAAAGAVVWRYGLAAELAPGSPRSWYFTYVAILLGLGIVCARWPRITMVVLSLAAIELGLCQAVLCVMPARLAPIGPDEDPGAMARAMRYGGHSTAFGAPERAIDGA